MLLPHTSRTCQLDLRLLCYFSTLWTFHLDFMISWLLLIWMSVTTILPLTTLFEPKVFLPTCCGCRIFTHIDSGFCLHVCFTFGNVWFFRHFECSCRTLSFQSPTNTTRHALFIFKNITLHFISFGKMSLHYATLHCIALHYITLHVLLLIFAGFCLKILNLLYVLISRLDLNNCFGFLFVLADCQHMDTTNLAA